MASRCAISRSDNVFLTTFGVPGCLILPDDQTIEPIDGSIENETKTLSGFDTIEFDAIGAAGDRLSC